MKKFYQPKRSMESAERIWEQGAFDDLEERADVRVDSLNDWIFTDPVLVEPDPDREHSNRLLFREDAPSVFTGLHEGPLGLDGLDDEDDQDFNFSFGTEPHPPASRHLSDAGGRSKEVEITYEDFEEEEQLAVQLLTHYMRNAYVTSTKTKARQRALDFVFANQCADNEVPFSVCCQALGVREHVLKTRLMFEYYLRWIICEDMPFLTLPLPDELAEEVIFKAGLTGFEISRIAWAHPGIRLEAISDRISAFYSPEDIRLAIRILESTGSLSLRGDSIYFTGKNPTRMQYQPIERTHKRSPVIWSRLW